MNLYLKRYGSADDFWHMGLNTLKQTVASENTVAGGSRFPHCSEAWDAISRYIYTGLQGWCYYERLDE